MRPTTMKIMGIDIQGSDANAVLVDGEAEHCTITNPGTYKIPFPTLGTDEAVNLLAFQKQIQALVHESQAEAVAVVKATNSKFGLSPQRVKLECMIQLACHEERTPCTLVPPQTVSAAEKKKLQKVAGVDMEAQFANLTPKYLRRAAYCGWVCLHDRGDQGSA